MHKFISGLYGMKKHGEDQFLCHPYYLLLHFLSILISIHQVGEDKADSFSYIANIILPSWLLHI